MDDEEMAAKEAYLSDALADLADRVHRLTARVQRLSPQADEEPRLAG